MRIALVVMPWIEADKPPLGVAVLKSYLQMHGHSVDCLYLNLRMFSKVGGVAADLANENLWPEWLFGYHLFGPGGLGELPEGIEALCRAESFQRLFKLRADIDAFKGRLAALVHDDIPSFIDECLEQIPWGHYQLIGFSSSFHTHTASLKLARELKTRYPATPIVFGGANLEGPMGLETLKGCSWIDYVVDGEGEQALLALVRNLESGRPYHPIPRISFRREGEIVQSDPAANVPIDLNLLPTPDHDDYFRDLRHYGLENWVQPCVTFEASRGCWWGQKQHCTFCGINGRQMAFRSKGTEGVVRDILALHRRHRAKSLAACDNIIGLEHLRELVPELGRVRKEQGLDWKIHFETKANMTPAHMEAFAEAGITRLQAGIESLSTPILRLMRKGTSAIQNIQTIKLSDYGGAEISWAILWGFPGEDEAEYTRMAELALSLTHLQPPLGCNQISVDRSSPYQFDWEKLGTGKPRPAGFYKFLYPEPRFSHEEIAYYFEFTRPGTPPSRVAVLREVVALWKRLRHKNIFAFSRGLDFIELYDSRPLSLTASPGLRENLLEGMEALIFGLCDTIKGFGQILSACRQARPDCTPEFLQGILDKMVKKKWMYRENGHYLNLAIPVSRLPAPQKVLFDSLSALRLSYAARWTGGRSPGTSPDASLDEELQLS